MANVISADAQADKHYLHVGFSASISESYSSPFNNPMGITWDGTNVISADRNYDKHYLHVGFSASISNCYSSPWYGPRGITWDDENVISADNVTVQSHYLHAGFSASISNSYASPDPFGITWDGTNVISVYNAPGPKHYLHVGFSASISNYYSSPSTDPTGITWDGTNVISADALVNKHYLHVGFSASISNCYSSPSTFPTGITWDGRYFYTNIWHMLSADSLAARHYLHLESSSVIITSYASPGPSPQGIAWTLKNNAISADNAEMRHYQHSGFSAAITDSYWSPSTDPQGITTDVGANVLSADNNANRHYKHVQFSSSISDSYSSPFTQPTGISWDGANVISADASSQKHYLHVGFSNTVSNCYSSPDSEPTGITWDGTNVISADLFAAKHYIHTGFSGIISDSFDSPGLSPTGVGFGFPAKKFTKELAGELTFSGTLTPAKTPYFKTLEGSLTFDGLQGNTRPWNIYKPFPPDDPEFDPEDPDKPQEPGGTIWHKVYTGVITFLNLFGHTDAFIPPAPPGGTEFKKELEGALWSGGDGDSVSDIGTRRDDDPPDPPHPPETGITFHRSRTGRVTFSGELEAEQTWPGGLIDKGTLEDSLTLIDTVTSGGPSGRLSTSRNHPHRGKYYLAVHKPEKIFCGEVDSVTPGVGGTEVTYINSVGERLICVHGMTVKVYTSAGVYKGKVRLRYELGAATLHVAEQDDLDWAIGDLFEIYDVIELWARFPRVIIDPGDPTKLIWYRDWNITPADVDFPMQAAHTMCVPIIGPPTCAFLEDGSASIYFTAKDSYNVNPLTPPAWWSWKFYDAEGVPSSNLETPGDITWATAGVFRVECQVETGVPTWRGHPAFRYVHIFERTGENAPYTNFNVLNLSGSVSEGGWNAEFEVYTDVDIADFPEGAQVILFAEEELGGYDFGSEEPPEYRSEVKYVGYIIGGSVTKDPETRVTRFRTSGVQTLMKNRDNFSLALDYVAETTADDWTKQDVLTPNYAFVNLLLWNSTLMRLTDVFLPAYYYELWQSISHKASDYLVKYQDFGRGALWRQMDSLAKDVFARIIVDRFGRVSICNDPQHTIEADLWADLPVPYTFGTLDWETPLTIEFVDEPVTSVICVEGIAFDGATATAVIGYHPGELPTYRGRIQTRSGCVLSSQNEAEFLAQGLFSIQNNTYPRVVIKCLGNYSFVDLADLGGIQISLAAADTRYGLAWDNKRFFVEAVANAIDFQTGLLTTELQLVAFAYLRRPGIGA